MSLFDSMSDLWGALKPYVNGLVRKFDGWMTRNETWSYVGALSVKAVGDLRNDIQAGDMLKLKQTTWKFFYVMTKSYSLGYTTFTLISASGGYSVANAAITDVFVSHTPNSPGMTDGTLMEHCVGGYGTITANNNVLLTAMRTDFDWLATRCEVMTHVAATNDGSNYWTISVKGQNLAYTGTSLYSFNTSADGTPAGYGLTNHSGYPTTPSPGANDSLLVVYAAKTGSPGALYCWSQIYWRLVKS